MLVLTNLEPTSTFSIFLEGKIKEPTKPLYLVLRRQADLVDYEFLLTNESTSINYFTFTISSSGLPKGDYDARIYNGDYITSATQDCLVDVPIQIDQPEFFLCDPTTVETSIVLNSIMQVGATGTPADVIMTAKSRVFGNEQEFYINQAAPIYTVYEG
jgi:hypothetical protein